MACACSGMGVDEMYIKGVNTKEEKSSQKIIDLNYPENHPENYPVNIANFRK